MTQAELTERMRAISEEIDVLDDPRRRRTRELTDEESGALAVLYARHSALYAIGSGAEIVRQTLRECGVYEGGEVAP